MSKNWIPIGDHYYGAHGFYRDGKAVMFDGTQWYYEGPPLEAPEGIRFIVTDEVVKGNNGMFTKEDRIRAQRINKAKKRVKKAIEYFMGEHSSLRQREEAYIKLERERKHLDYLGKAM